ncbi:MAG: phytanoyl-CoA dioxygenase [Actinobacteria bacterium]|nr:phytanoyl-CoA dioxygenase [Actinomycetota bacterium]
MTASAEFPRSEYQRHGVVVLRGVLAPHEVDLLREGIDAVMANPSPRAKVASAPDDPGFFIEDFCTWRDHPAFESVIRTSRLATVAAELMGSRTVTMYHDHILVKEPGTRQRTPWHQDQPYYDVEGVQNVSFWIPVDPVSREDCLEVIAGTHRGPWLMPRSFLDQQAKWFPEGSLTEMPNYDAERSAHTIVSADLQPGDCIAFHMLAVHGAPGVSGTNRRRVFSLRLLGDDMVFAPRDWTTSPEMTAVFDGPDSRVSGEPLTGDWFPRLL